MKIPKCINLNYKIYANKSEDMYEPELGELTLQGMSGIVANSNTFKISQQIHARRVHRGPTIELNETLLFSVENLMKARPYLNSKFLGYLWSSIVQASAKLEDEKVIALETDIFGKDQYSKLVPEFYTLLTLFRVTELEPGFTPIKYDISVFRGAPTLEIRYDSLRVFNPIKQDLFIGDTLQTDHTYTDRNDDTLGFNDGSVFPSFVCVGRSDSLDLSTITS